MIKIQNDDSTKWILATAQAVEGLNLLQQAVKSDAILKKKETLDIIFGNVRTQNVKDLFKLMYRQSETFPQIDIPIKKASNQQKSGKIYPIAIANHIDNICRELQTIYKSAKTGHIKDWGCQILTEEKDFEHPPMDLQKIAKQNSTAKITSIHVKYDGKAKQPNDPTTTTEHQQFIMDCFIRGWISQKAQNILKGWFKEYEPMMDPFSIDDIYQRVNQCLDIVRIKLEVDVYVIRRCVLINNNLIQRPQ